MKNKQEELTDELRPEYEFDYSKAVRGKYYGQLLAQGANVVVLDADIAEAFHDSAAVIPADFKPEFSPAQKPDPG